MSSGTPRPDADARVPVTHSTVAAGATNTPKAGPSAPEGFQAASDEMRGEVARALGYAGVSPFEIEDFRIEDVADRLHRAGYRRVSCPHCTARTGSCVCCGVRDAEGVDGEQLCGQCDLEVEAEAAQSAALRDGGQ